MTPVRCAIYTRKSTDEGLDKEFNTLEAQRESGENYVKSQKHQGWVILSEHYDDGGYSGGNMNRPALKRLFEDIKANKVDMIVVYKIDRLTRSLTDFSKMVEVLDAHKCSFISVTQNFNTADSMGRLTLNMLLSFAQFEREVSGERIRDKVAASKKKGMWTGGPIPFGYKSVNKKLVIDEHEATGVRFMFETYLKHHSITAVGKLLEDEGYPSFRKNSIRRMLQSQIYLGNIVHKGVVYKGQHEAIIDKETFDAVQTTRETKEIKEPHKRACLFKKNEVGILRGLLKCACCDSPMTPTASQSKGVRRYYYTSTKAKYYGYRHCHQGSLPVKAMDTALLEIIKTMLHGADIVHKLAQKVASTKTKEIFKALQDSDKIVARMTELERHLMMKQLIELIVINYDKMEIHWTEVGLRLLTKYLKEQTCDGVTTMALPFIRSKGALQIVLPEDIKQQFCPNTELIKGISRGFRYQKILRDGKMTIAELGLQEELDPAFIGRLLRLTSLSPEIIHSILKGRQPANFCLKTLIREDVPPIWEEQEKLYTFV